MLNIYVQSISLTTFFACVSIRESASVQNQAAEHTSCGLYSVSCADKFMLDIMADLSLCLYAGLVLHLV